MRLDGGWFKDDAGRTMLLRGVNFSGSTKVPVTPNGATYIKDGFWEHRDVSFVGRPCPLEEADEHFGRMRQWGLTFVRLLTTWEAIEHGGPGVYDEAYLDYLRAIVEKAAEHEIQVFIDPHQDVWSRWTGGDGAPGWTFDLIGMDITRLEQAGCALTHQGHGDPLPRMVWPTNYTKLGAGTMFTLFFGGNDFAPATLVDGAPIQDFLQQHYINAIVKVAERVRGLANVVGYDTLNEPGHGYIALDLEQLPPLRIGPAPTPFQSMQLGSGHPQEVGVWEMTLHGPRQTGTTLLNPDAVSVWKPGHECIWKQNGVWSDEGGTARLLRPDHFKSSGGREADFPNGYLKPFMLRFTEAIRRVEPRAWIFLENFPGFGYPSWGPDDPEGAVHATHWYDIMTLFTKNYDRTKTAELGSGRPVEGAAAVQQFFNDQLGAVKHAGDEHMGGIPTLVGEFGLPFDLDEKEAYRSGDFSNHIHALDAYIDAMDTHLLSYTLWNYTPDNSNERGDLWNDEDLSIFSRDQQSDPSDIHSGGRGLAGIVRPYARRTAGEPRRMRFELETRTFELVFQPDPAVDAPTEIFVPDYQYPQGYDVALSAGSFTQDDAGLRLLVDTRGVSDEVTLRITPRG
jgi:hypothetical protein